MKSLTNLAWYLLGLAFNAFVLILTVYLIVTLTLRAFDYGKDFAEDLTAKKESREITVTLRDNATLTEVAQILEDNGIVKSALFYRIESMFNGGTSDFLGGTYTVNANMNSIELNRALRYKENDDLVITIREGYSLKDIGEYLEANEIVTAEEFVDACENGVYDYAFLQNIPARENRLEGYLFPDTYFIARGSTPEQIINKMLARFDNIYNEDCRYLAHKIGRTMDEIIVIASIIEKEILVDAERGLAASVIYNRLNGDYRKLEMCSTIMYALDKRKDRLTDEDLRIESRYNTYLYPGLPVGPICNPGEASIRAALEPGDTEYQYFVLKDDESGEHVFTQTYDEFLTAKGQYNQKY